MNNIGGKRMDVESREMLADNNSVNYFINVMKFLDFLKAFIVSVYFLMIIGISYHVLCLNIFLVTISYKIF